MDVSTSRILTSLLLALDKASASQSAGGAVEANRTERPVVLQA